MLDRRLCSIDLATSICQSMKTWISGAALVPWSDAFDGHTPSANEVQTPLPQRDELWTSSSGSVRHDRSATGQ